MIAKKLLYAMSKHPENIIIPKHSSVSGFLYNGPSGTVFNLSTEQMLIDFTNNKDKFEYYGQDGDKAIVIMKRIDGIPVGNNGEIFMEMVSGYKLEVHGFPLSSNKFDITKMTEYAPLNDKWIRK